MDRRTWTGLVVVLAATWAAPLAGQVRSTSGVQRAGPGRSLGMVMDYSRRLYVFDAAQDTVLGVVPLRPLILACSDCAITPDLTLGFVVTNDHIVWVIDLVASPPVLASGTNPIPISNLGEDVVVSPDGRYLLVSDGSAVEPLSVIDIAARAEIFTLSPAPDTNSVDMCADGSVLATSNLVGGVRRLLLDGSGSLTDTGEFLAAVGPNNAHFAPGCRFGVVVSQTGHDLRSFEIPGLALRDTQSLGGRFGPHIGLAAAFDPLGTRVFVRTQTDLQAFAFDPGTGAIGPSLFRRDAEGTPTCFGLDQVAVHPDGTKIYVSLDPAKLDVLDLDGQSLGTITHPFMYFPVSISIQGGGARQEHLDVKPGACPNSFNPGSHGVLPVTLLGTEDFDVRLVDRSSLRLARADGIGGSIAPHEGPPGAHTTIEDLATPYEGERCDCNQLEGDGLDDLALKFRTDDLVPALELDQLPTGALVELVLSGSNIAGIAFEASDCVRLVPPGTQPGRLEIVSPSVNGWIQVSPLDLLLDGGGFGEFERVYPMGTVVTLTAQEFEGLRFAGWDVDGVMQTMGERTIELTVTQTSSTILARYRPALRKP